MLFFDGFSQRFPRKFSHGMRCLLSKAWWRDWRRLRPWQMRRKNPWEHRMRTAARFLIWRCWWLFLLMLYGFSPWKSYCFEMFYGFSPVLKISGIFVSRLFGWDLKKYVCVCVCVCGLSSRHMGLDQATRTAWRARTGTAKHRNFDLQGCSSKCPAQGFMTREHTITQRNALNNIDAIPVVPHKAVAEVSKIGNL